MTIGRVAELWRYPVKSLGGELLEQANIGRRGVLGDRLWAIRDLERDITASARRIPALLTATARYPGPVPSEAGPGNVPEVEITFPDGTVVSSSDDDVHAKLSELAGREVRLTALPPADDTSLHRLRRDHQTDALSSASLRARRRSQRHDADRALRRAQPRATRTRSRSQNYSGRGRPGGAVPRCLLRCRARRHCRSG